MVNIMCIPRFRIPGMKICHPQLKPLGLGKACCKQNKYVWSTKLLSTPIRYNTVFALIYMELKKFSKIVKILYVTKKMHQKEKNAKRKTNKNHVKKNK